MSIFGVYPYLLLATFVLFVVLVICWIVLPFAVIGTKPLLHKILAEQKRTNELLEGHEMGHSRDQAIVSCDAAVVTGRGAEGPTRMKEEGRFT